MTYTRGVAVSPNVPWQSGGAVVAYTVTPALPPGIVLDPRTGVISGTATAVSTGSYRVIASNAAGSSSVDITIIVNDVAPSNLTYANNPVTYTKDQAIAPNTLTSAGGVVTALGSPPTLPPGLSLDGATGAITGTPTALAPTSTYYVTATNTGGSATTAVTLSVETLAQQAQATITGDEPASTPFARRVLIAGTGLSAIASASFEIASKSGAVSRPFTATLDASYLRRMGLLESDTQIKVLVFGLYAGAVNPVTLTLTYADGSSTTLAATLQADAWVSPSGGIYTSPIIAQGRTSGDGLGFDYFWIKGFYVSAMLLDSDGNVRWAGMDYPSDHGWSGMVFHDGSVFTGQDHLIRYELDGSMTKTPLTPGRSFSFHHDITVGKRGLLAEVDGLSPLGVGQVESILLEVSPTDGSTIKEWDMADIFRQTMAAGGDDPSNFVRDGVDWFHMNSAVYVTEDDSLLVSSRENFVVKLDYETGRIKWLFGDPTKHWYKDYPSLRQLAVSLPDTELYPIGQHALSTPAPGEVLLFDNGTASLNNPTGTSAGAVRPYSSGARFRVHDATRTAQQVWRYDAGERIRSAFCSSVFEAAPGQYVLNYSVSNETSTELVGLGDGAIPVFDLKFTMATNSCNTSFHAKPYDAGTLR